MPEGPTSSTSASPTAARASARAPDPAAGASAPAPAESAGVSAELEVIRGIIVGPDRERVSRVEHRLDSPTLRARELSEALPEAIAIRAAKDQQLARALGPTIEASLKRTVAKNPQPLVDAIFPIIGPAIRKAIGESLQRMLQELSGALEQQFSIRSLRWRLEAWKTGKSFAEVVLLHTLQYQVEQAFLIHRETGLVLAHLAIASVNAEDPNSVAAMLTALRDFMRDSTKTSEDLEGFKTGGGRHVWVEGGPRAVLALWITGAPNESLRPRMQEALESVHLQFAQELGEFQGDAAPFANAAPILEPLLGAVRQQQAEPMPRVSPVVWVILAVLVGLGAWWGVSWWIAARDFDRAVGALRSTPGVFVTEVGGGGAGGKRFIGGLRDPLADDPMKVLTDAGVRAQDVELRFKAFQSLDESFVSLRVRAALNPPASVELSLAGGKLTAKGRASHPWIAGARRAAAQIPGVTKFDDSELVDLDLEQLEILRGEAQGLSVRFIFASTELAKGQDEPLNRLAATLLDMYELARPAAIQINVQVIGNTDGSGVEERNVRLSRDRADRVVTLLVARGIPAQDLTAVGVGSTLPMAQETTEAAKERNRYAGIKVLLSEAPLQLRGGAPGRPGGELRPPLPPEGERSEGSGVP